MELLLFILKIILIVFIAAVGIVLTLLALVLFLPIRYQITGEIHDNFEIELNGSLRYCFSIFKLLFSYRESEFDYHFSIFGFRKKRKALEAEETEYVSSQATSKIDAVEEAPPSQAAETERKQPKKESPSETEKKREKKKRISNDVLVYWKQQLTDEHNKSVLNKFISELRYLLRHFKFRKIKTNLVFSAGDPALTGQIFGILCMIPFLYQYEVQLVPDFETDHPCLKGTFSVSGRLRLVHVLITIGRLLFDKEVRIRIKNMKAAI